MATVIVSAGEIYDVSSGQTDTNDVVQSGGQMYVLSGGTANTTTVDKGGLLTIEPGGNDSGTILHGSETILGSDTFDLTILGGTVNVPAGATADIDLGSAISGFIGVSGTLTMSGFIFKENTTVVATDGGKLTIEDPLIWQDSGTGLIGAVDTQHNSSYAYLSGGFENDGELVASALGADSFAELTMSALSAGVLNNTELLASAANDGYAKTYLTVSGGTITNSGNMEAAATTDGAAYLYINGGSAVVAEEFDTVSGGGGGGIINSGLIAASALYEEGDAFTYVSAGDVSNTAAGTIDASALTGYAEVGINATFFTNAGMLLANAGSSGGAELYVTVGTSGTNTGVIEALAHDDSYADVYLEGDFNNVSGTIVASAGSGADAFVYLQDATVVGGTLQTIGADAGIGVDDGDTGVIVSATIVSNSYLFAEDDGTLVVDNTVVQGGSTIAALEAGTVAVIGTKVTNSATNAILALASDSEAFAYVTGTDHVGNLGLIEGSATVDGDAHVGVVGGTVGNKGTIEAAATFISDAFLSVEGGAVTNSGTIAGKAGGDSEVLALIGGPTITNAKGGLIEISATVDSEALGFISADTLTNKGTIEAVATSNGIGDAFVDGRNRFFTAEVSISAGTITNAKGGTIAALAHYDSEAFAFVSAGSSLVNRGVVKAGATNFSYAEVAVRVVGTTTSGGTLTNSGTFEAVAKADSEAALFAYVSGTSATGGTFTNARGGIVEASSTNESDAFVGIRATTVTNRGTVVASATGGSGSYPSDAFVGISGSTITNAASGTIEALAKNFSEAEVAVLVSSGGSFLNNGLVEASATNDAYAEVGILVSSGGTATNSGTMVAKANEAEARVYVYLSGAEFINQGTVEAFATHDADAYADIEGRYETVSSSTVYPSAINSGTMVASATADSYAQLYVDLSGGTLTNANMIEALATSSSTAEVEIQSAVVENSGGTILASGDGTSEAEIYLNDDSIVGGTLQTIGPFSFVSAHDTVFESATIASDTLVVLDGSDTLKFGNTIGAGAAVVTADGGFLYVSGTVTNSGVLYASAPDSEVIIESGTVVNGGVAAIFDGIVDIEGSSNENVTFVNAGTGGLELGADTSASLSAYGGTVTGFGGVNNGNTAQYIDFTNVTYSSGVESASFDDTDGTAGGVLEVFSSGVEIAAVNLSGNYTNASFTVSEGSGDTLEVTDPSTLGYSQSQGGGSTGHLGSYMATTFADIGVSNGGSVITNNEEHHTTLTTAH